jgi:hypothetical protein
LTELARPQIVISWLSATLSLPLFLLVAVDSRQSAKKREPSAHGSIHKKSGPACAAPDFCQSPKRNRSVAEEQPQQNDHRDRHAQQPQQDSTSHGSFSMLDEGETRGRSACS